MPLYEYKCLTCGYSLEVLQKVNEPRLKKCPKCGLIQGLPNDKLGVKIWYCDWVYKKVNKKLKKIKERISEKIFINSFNDLNDSNIS